MSPKKKLKLHTSLAKQLLEDFYNDLNNETFLGNEFGGEDEATFLALLQTLMLMSLVKVLIVLHNQLMKKT